MKPRRAVGALVACAATVATSGATLAAHQAGAATSIAVHGGWIGELPCVFTSVGAAPPSTALTFTCISGTTWDGDWTGHTQYVVKGSTDPSTGDVSGTIDETFTGVDTATHATGTIHLLGTLTVASPTDTIVVSERIAEASGAFADYRGDLTFEGTQASGVVGHGGYHGDVKR